MKDETLFVMFAGLIVLVAIAAGAVLKANADDEGPVYVPTAPAWEVPDYGGDPDAYRTPLNNNRQPVCPGPNCPY